MRIALVSDWCLPRLGGIELQLRDLPLQLRSPGFAVQIITPLRRAGRARGWSGPLPGRSAGAPGGDRLHRGRFRRTPDLFGAGHYDVVHVHFGIIAPAAYGATCCAHRLGLPTVATFLSVLTHFDLPLVLVRAMMAVADWRVQWSAVSSLVAETMRPLREALHRTDVFLLPLNLEAFGIAALEARAAGVPVIAMSTD